MRHRSKLFDIPTEELQYLCDNSDSKTEVLEKLNMCSHGGNHSTLRKVFDEKGIDETKLKENRENAVKYNSRNKKAIPLSDIIYSQQDFKYQSCKLKQRLISEGIKPYQCENCLNTEWLNKPIPLQLHHKDGNHNNNNINNLQLLCPNCHSLTDTFAGRKLKKDKIDKKIRHTHTTNIVRKKGISEDGTKYYDGYGNYKILCPICNKNFMTRTAKMCMNCRAIERNTPRIPSEVLRNMIIEGRSYEDISNSLKIDRDTIRKYLKYYAENIPIDNIPNRDELKQKIRCKSLHDVSKEYKVSERLCRIWYRLQGIPYTKHSIDQIADDKWLYI